MLIFVGLFVIFCVENQAMGIREAGISGVPIRHPARPKIRDTGEERIRYGSPHVGECDWKDPPQDRDENPLLPLPQLHIGNGRAVSGVRPDPSERGRNVVREASLRLRR